MKGKDILFGLTDVGNDLIEKAEYGQFPSDTKSCGEKESHGIIRIRRPLSVAAIIALMVLLMGCAVLLLHLEDLRIGEETYVDNMRYAEDGSKIPATEKVKQYISISGAEGSANFLAMQEWMTFKEHYDPDGSLWRKNAGFERGAQYRNYVDAYSQEMLDKIDEICRKYDLKLEGDAVIFQESAAEVFTQVLGIPGITAEKSNLKTGFGGARVAECGNFNASYRATLQNPETSQEFDFTLIYDYRDKDYFTSAYITIEDGESVEQWNYTLPDRTEVLIASDKGGDAYILYDREDAFITVERVLRWAAARPAAADDSADTGNGLELSKTATANGDGTYTIRMEAYTTGNVIHTTKTIPVDIVLVLDQSGSMAYDFNGNETNKNSERRQYAMKQAVNSFIAAVAEKYNAENADHRMAIVTFGSGASKLQDWTPVDANGKTTLQGKITGLSNRPSGGTQTDDGMALAEHLMIGDGYSYNGDNMTRQKVVIVFTDGVPGDNDFDVDVADAAIRSAKALKDKKVTVYSVGIYSGANPNELYGASGFDTNSDGTVDSQWIMDTWGLFPGTDFPEADRPAGNRFLNYLSSNCPEAVSVGLERSTRGLGILHYKITYKITANSPRTDSSYYLTAKDSGSLNTIFKTISENIQSANIDLGSKTMVKDTISPYFDLPANTSDVKLYTAAAKADGTFEDKKPAPAEVVATVQDGAVSVTGFDFNANFVSEKAKEDGTYGKKLIIEFTVTPKTDFIGGNDVPTNDWEKTAVYDKNNTEVEKFADANTTPTVNVPIKTPAFNVNNKTIYEGNSTAVNSLYNLPDTTGWQYDFVNVTAGANNVTEETVSPTDCTDYTVKVTYAPKTDGAKSKGTPNDMTGVVKELTATVHVLKPTVTATVNDVQKYYGESYTLGDAANGAITVEWADKTEGDTDIPAAEGTAPYTNADLSLAYSTKAFTGQSGTVPKHDFDVTVKVMKGNDEIKGAVITTTCGIADSGCTTPATDGKYTVHVKTCQLTITKAGGTNDEPYVFTVYKDGEKYTEVTIVGNGSVTIYELPVGTYAIEEDTGWSWRFTPTISSDVALNAKTPTGEITCTNTLNEPYWLNGFSAVVKNVFGIANN